MNSLSLAILQRASGEPAGPDSEVSVAPDRIVLSGARSPGVVSALRDAGMPHDPHRIILSLDFHAPDVEAQVPRARALCREYAAAAGIHHLFDLNAGIGSKVMVEWSLVRPGHLVVGCGMCLGLAGGVGALGLRWESGPLTTAALAGNASWIVPEVLGVRLSGRLPRARGPWDLARAVRRAAGDALRGRVVEIHGDTEPLSVDFRSALCGLLGEMGALAALVHPDDTLRDWLTDRGHRLEAPEPVAGNGVADVIEVELDEVPSVVAPSYAGEDRELVDLTGEAVHGAFVGSCYGGHEADLSTAAEIIRRAGEVDPGVRLVVSPASLDVARAALHAGYYEVFLQGGAMLTVAGAGAGSIGGGAVLGAGETMVATSEYHPSIPPGQEGPASHVLSPAAAVAAAVAGRFVDPSDYVA